jgi:hypothetical protein
VEGQCASITYGKFGQNCRQIEQLKLGSSYTN